MDVFACVLFMLSCGAVLVWLARREYDHETRAGDERFRQELERAGWKR